MSTTLNSTLTLDFKNDIATRFVNAYQSLPNGTLLIVLEKDTGNGNFQLLNISTNVLTTDLGVGTDANVNTATIIIERTNGIPLEIPSGENVGRIQLRSQAIDNRLYAQWTPAEPIVFPNGGNLLVERLDFVLGDPA
jgi:hypothetical protein